MSCYTLPQKQENNLIVLEEKDLQNITEREVFQFLGILKDSKSCVALGYPNLKNPSILESLWLYEGKNNSYYFVRVDGRGGQQYMSSSRRYGSLKYWLKSTLLGYVTAYECGIVIISKEEFEKRATVVFLKK